MGRRIEEVMVRQVVGRFTIRCWIDLPNIDEYGFTLNRATERLKAVETRLSSQSDIAELFLLELEDCGLQVNAIEVLNAQGIGILIYPDWP